MRNSKIKEPRFAKWLLSLLSSYEEEFISCGDLGEEFKEIVDVYITFPDMVKSNYLYITDARYSYFYRDAKTTKTDATEKLIPLKGQDEIFHLIKDGNSMVISTHTHRYFTFEFIEIIRLCLYKTAKCVAGFLYNTNWGKRIINKFYYIAKKI